jgi:sugar fermentation stimulation protein A
VAVRRGAERSRIDLLLQGPRAAPTLRGTRHLSVLASRARRGLAAAVVLCAQRGDVRAIAADASIDPAFARALARARRAGVRVVGLCARAGPRGMRLIGEVPVLLAPGAVHATSGLP